MASGPTIVAKFVADTKDLTRGVDQAAGGMNTKLGGFSKNAGKMIASGLATGAIIKFGKDSVDAASADAEAQAILAQTLRNTTGATEDQVAATEDFISKLSKQTAIADDDLRPAMANLVRGFGNVEDAQTALSLATDISAGTGKDLGSVSEALMKAANGQTGALGRLGIQTKDQTGKAKSLDEIMGDLSDTFGGQAAAAADTAAGRAREASIQFGELQETIGAGLLPVISELAPILSTLATFLADNVQWIVPLVAAYAAWTVATTIATTAQTLFGVSLGISVGWIALIAAAVVGVAVLIIKNWDTIVAATSAAWDAIVGAVRFVWDWIKNNWPLLLAIITGPIGAAVLVIVRNWDTIKAAAVAVWDWLNGTWQTVTQVISGPIEAAGRIIGTAWDGIKTGAQAVLDFITDIFGKIAGAVEAVVGGIKTAIGHVVDALKAPINLFIRGWNAVEFKIPSVDLGPLGSLGGQTIGLPDIPQLAQGGLLTSPTLFLGGEAGTEIVAPEAMLRAIVAEESGRGSYTLNMYPRTAEPADVVYAFKRLELMAGVG